MNLRNRITRAYKNELNDEKASLTRKYAIITHEKRENLIASVITKKITLKKVNFHLIQGFQVL